jgi:hypothetical protein
MPARSRSALRRSGSPRRPGAEQVGIHGVVRSYSGNEKPVKQRNSWFGSRHDQGTWWSSRTPYEQPAKFLGVPASSLWGPAKPTEEIIAQATAEGYGSEYLPKGTLAAQVAEMERSGNAWWLTHPTNPDVEVHQVTKNKWSLCNKILGTCVMLTGAALTAYMGMRGGTRRLKRKRGTRRKA